MSEQNNFYHLNGKSAKFDIDEDIGRLLVQADSALDFIHRGPPVLATPKVIDEMYEAKVVKLIPKIRTLLESRVMVKYPYVDLVNMSFNVRHDLLPAAKPTELDKLGASIGKMHSVADDLQRVFDGYDPTTKEPINAQAMMLHLATMMEHTAQIMALFGWTIDDVRLASRKQISELMEGSTPLRNT